MNSFISVGIDVGSEFSFMSIALPDSSFVGKPFKILHSDLDSLEAAVSSIKKAEESYSMVSQIFLESTGIYHYPLFCYLRDRNFDVKVINPIISNSTANFNIRKVHNDKFDSRKLALLGLNPNLKISVIPCELVLNLRNLVREYYNLIEERSKYIIKPQTVLHKAFPQYIKIFSKITVKTSLKLLERFTSPDNFIAAQKSEILSIINDTARFGSSYVEAKYNALIKALKEAKSFGNLISSDLTIIRMYIGFINTFNKSVENILNEMHSFVDLNENEPFVKQIYLIETIKGTGFLTAVTIMCEIGDFSAFKKPKQLLAYFGLDPAVRQSGKFTASSVKISKRGSKFARKAIHTIALVCIGKSRKGIPNNSVLNDYYTSKRESKPKMVALVAVMHKVCNIIFAVLRDDKPFQMISPEEHNKQYHNSLDLPA